MSVAERGEGSTDKDVHPLSLSMAAAAVRSHGDMSVAHLDLRVDEGKSFRTGLDRRGSLLWCVLIGWLSFGSDDVSD